MSKEEGSRLCNTFHMYMEQSIQTFKYMVINNKYLYVGHAVFCKMWGFFLTRFKINKAFLL